MVATVLPSNNQPPVYPFLGFVVNLNVVTRSHRDASDLMNCLVTVIEKDLEDGDLVLIEPGLVIPLRTGDWILFPSCDISHLNLHYKGYRCSFVFQTDRRMCAWLDNQNNWEHSTYIDHIIHTTN